MVEGRASHADHPGGRDNEERTTRIFGDCEERFTTGETDAPFRTGVVENQTRVGVQFDPRAIGERLRTALRRCHGDVLHLRRRPKHRCGDRDCSGGGQSDAGE
jgi:hypothetical protein